MLTSDDEFVRGVSQAVPDDERGSVGFVVSAQNGRYVRMLIIVLVLLLSASTASSATAEEMNAAATASSEPSGVDEASFNLSSRDEQAPQPFAGALSVLFDNDFFVGKDNRYTAGFAFAWTSAAAETYGKRNIHRKIVRALSFLPTVNAAGYRNYLQMVLGMEMFTPSDITVPDPPPGEHPYAGILYLDSSVMSTSRISNHQFTLRLGFVGPAAGASEVQKWIHEAIGSDIPQGWDTQLSNEPIVNLFYQYSRRLLRRAPSDRVGGDLTLNGGGGLGNYYIGANVGLMARVGFRLPDNYGITPLLGGAESVVGLMPARKRFYAYAFLASQAFGVVRWLPTDGNTFAESRSGKRNDGYASLSAGFVAGYGRLVLAYRFHGITGLTDLESIRANNRNDFGTLALTVFFG